MQRFWMIMAFVALVWSGVGYTLTASHAQDDTHGTWTELAPLNIARSEHAAAVVDGQIYTIGGFGADYSDTTSPSTFERYDPATDTWTQLPDLPEIGRHHLMMAAFDGKLYVFGGTHIIYNATLNSRLPYVYDPATETWATLAEMPSRRTGGVAVVVDEYIYLVGGTGTTAENMHLLRYDPAEDVWAELAVPSVVRDHVAAVAYQGEIWAIGGRDIGREDFTSVEIYNPITDEWRAGPDLNIGRAGFGATVVGEDIYVAGGELLASCNSFPCATATVEASMERYDPTTDSWTVIAEMPLALHGLPLISIDHTIYVIGGSVAAAGVDNPGRVFAYALAPTDAPSQD